ncbi:MAG: hypothetical protein H7222_10125 [Methylotenera sp.]|nr:hypothetical protein [Oligoflexia bacterium]
MNFYQIQLSAGQSVNQTDLMNAIKTHGGDTVQSSQGLYARINLSTQEFKDVLPPEDVKHLNFREINPDEALSDESLEQNVKLFLTSYPQAA